MPKTKIIISVTSDLCTDQRVQKVSLSLYEAGYDILLLGRQLRKSRSFDSVYPFKRFRLIFEKGFLFYAEFNIRLFFFLLFKRVDIMLSNDTDTLIPNFLIAKIRRKKLVFDAHELFPEVPEVTDRKPVKAVWTGVENIIFPHLKNCYTVCQSIADYYNKRYGINMEVIHNFSYIEREKLTPKLNFKDKKIILYQGAVNVGRGIEWVIDAMPFIENAILVIIGKGDIYSQLKLKVNEMNLNNKVIFVGKVHPTELPAYTCSANIGLCLLEPKGLSYYYSLPNRIFDFMAAGVPVLATDFPEIANVVKTHRTGKVISHYEPTYLVETIQNMFVEWNEKEKERIKDLSKNFCWEKEEKKLISIFQQSKK
ncbi:MAG: glycosyltransferase [Paludibacteraceae bacterium]|nr:glycosyltransferase [Paludibacteraceae bacterium]